MDGENIHDDVILNLLVLRYLDVSRITYSLCGVVERDSYSRSHNNVAVLKAAVVYAVAKILLLFARNQFWQSIKTVIADSM